MWQLIVSVVLVSIYGFLAFVNFRDPVHSHAMLALTVRNSTPLFSMALSASSYPSFLTEFIIHFARKISAVHREQQPDLIWGSILAQQLALALTLWESYAWQICAGNGGGGICCYCGFWSDCPLRDLVFSLGWISSAISCPWPRYLPDTNPKKFPPHADTIVILLKIYMGEFYLFNSASWRIGTQLGSEFPVM